MADEYADSNHLLKQATSAVAFHHDEMQQIKIIKSFLQKIGHSNPVNTIVDINPRTEQNLTLAKAIYPLSKTIAIETLFADSTHSQADETINIDFAKQCLPFISGTVDIVIAPSLKTSREIAWIIHEITRSLKVGGYFIMGVDETSDAQSRVVSKQELVKFINQYFPKGYVVIAPVIEKRSFVFTQLARLKSWLLPNKSPVRLTLFRKMEPYQSQLIDQVFNLDLTQNPLL